MTALQVRRVRFDLDGDVPFLWNPGNPAFSLQLNAISIIAIAFEKFIVAAVREALPLITDPQAHAEGDAFLRQEAQHATCHRQHMRALIRRYPGLQETLDQAIATFDELTRTRSLAFRLAYIADLEATFTPWFTMLLDHDDTLFQPGDERVASLFLWHFVEEVEHRSSGLIVYQAVVRNRWYRMMVLPAVLKHVGVLTRLIGEGFNRHVPYAERQVDGLMMDTAENVRILLKRIRLPWRSVYPPPPPDPYLGVPSAERRHVVRRLLLTQTPYHDPGDQAVPRFAQRWFAHYESGADIAHWYSSQPVG